MILAIIVASIIDEATCETCLLNVEALIQAQGSEAGEGAIKVVESGDTMGDIARKRHFHVDICSCRASGGFSGI